MDISVNKTHLSFLNEKAFFIIAGPCVIEDESLTLGTAKALSIISRNSAIPLIFKSSFDKANRTSIGSFRGPGLAKGLKILDQVKKETGLPILSDIHSPDQAAPAAEVLDILQIPAFLVRQTDLLISAARTGKPVNLKKGQFLAPWDMESAINKLKESNAADIILTERGTTFGYNNLVVDMRSIPLMKRMGYPVVFDATHSVQLPGGKGNCSDGQREFVFDLAKAAVAAGADGIFMEVHPSPDKALCDAANSIPLEWVTPIIEGLKAIYDVIRKFNING